MSSEAHKRSQRMQKLFAELDDTHQQSVLEYVEFLHDRGHVRKQEIGVPEPIPRPENETVVGAIKRLKASYHMIESMSVFSDASALMTEHMINGRDAAEVIDEMETLFENAYQKLLQEQQE